jgi:arsenite methyltransferase
MDNDIKKTVRDKYSEIAVAAQQCGCSCCGADAVTTIDSAIMSDDYSHIQGYVPEADLGLGCGLPTEHADIREGNTVLDLGSGAGNDAFIARQIVGPDGRVIGVDFTDEMLAKARWNTEKLGFDNVEFRKGDIEDMPVDNGVVDVVISNCVLNLVPDKQKAFAEIFRVLKPGGHFCVSDIVLRGALPDGLLSVAAMYTGCVAGALQIDDYLQVITGAGFADVVIKKEKSIVLPDDVLRKYISDDQIADYKKTGTSILSVTVNASKPLGDAR